MDGLLLAQRFNLIYGYMVTMIAGKEPTIVKDGNCLPSSEK